MHCVILNTCRKSQTSPSYEWRACRTSKLCSEESVSSLQNEVWSVWADPMAVPPPPPPPEEISQPGQASPPPPWLQAEEPPQPAAAAVASAQPTDFKPPPEASATAASGRLQEAALRSHMLHSQLEESKLALHIMTRSTI